MKNISAQQPSMKRMVGFTLIEILVALFIFVIISTITAAALHNILQSQKIVRAQAEQLQQLQFALALMEQDIHAIIQRPIYADDFQFFPAFIGRSDYIEFSRGGLANPQGIEQRSTLLRLAWLCHDHQLIRRTWDHTDTPHRDHYHDKVLLQSVQNCHFAFLDKKLHTWNDWQDIQTQDKTPESSPAQEQPEILPKAIQYNLTSKTFGEGSLLWSITPAVYQHATT